MNPQDPLANLHPLREALPIGWWPPAPGWWVLAALLLTGLLLAIGLLLRRYRRRAYRRQALAQLESLRTDFTQTRDTVAYLAAANALLKSVALVAYPRRDVAASSGGEWLHLLNSSLGETEQFPADFVTGAYRKNGGNIDIENLHHCAALWIRRHEAKR